MAACALTMAQQISNTPGGHLTVTIAHLTREMMTELYASGVPAGFSELEQPLHRYLVPSSGQ